MKQLIKTIFTISLVFLLASSSRAENYTIRVGAVLPFSGSLAYAGNDIREGIQLALEERKDLQPKIEFIWEDGKFAPKESVSAAQKLISSDKVDFIISLWDTADVIAPVAEKAKVVQLSIRWNPDVAAKFKYTFTFESTYPNYYRDIVKLIKLENYSSAVFLHEETQAGTRERISFEESAKKEGVKVLGVDSFPTGESDFRGVLTKLLSKDADVFVNEGFPPASEILIKQLKTLRPDVRHIGFYEAIDNKDLIEGQPYVSQIGFTEEFSKKFEARFGHPYKVRAPHGYEIVRMIAWAYTETDKDHKPEIDAVKEKLSTLKDFDSVLGKLSVNGTRNIEHPNTYKVVRGGKVEAWSADK
jgi:branched-chain amino acid transport system substrate-binding protein